MGSNHYVALILLQDSNKNQGRVLVLEMEISRPGINRQLIRVSVQVMAINRLVSSRNSKRPLVVEIMVEEVRIFNIVSIILALRWDRDPISLSMGDGMRGSRILTTKVSTGSLVPLMRVFMMAVTGLIKEEVLVAMRIIVSVVRGGLPYYGGRNNGGGYRGMKELHAAGRTN
jgi:hypothetical protein